MDRRRFLLTSLAGALAAPVAAGAQPAGRCIGSLPGRLLVEGRYYGDRLDRVPAFAAELARLQVDVIVAAASPAPEAAKRATTTIPIVMANHSDHYN